MIEDAQARLVREELHEVRSSLLRLHNRGFSNRENRVPGKKPLTR
jgi:hypothetical protein